jgi:putative membrane protein
MPPCWVSPGMIKQFSDHAANERTYLAWMRTGIAIIAFGFVLERFDIFLLTITNSLGHSPAENLSHGGREAGVALIAAGLLTIGTAMRNFQDDRKRGNRSLQPHGPNATRHPRPRARHFHPSLRCKVPPCIRMTQPTATL